MLFFPASDVETAGGCVKEAYPSRWSGYKLDIVGGAGEMKASGAQEWPERCWRRYAPENCLLLTPSSAGCGVFQPFAGFPQCCAPG